MRVGVDHHGGGDFGYVVLALLVQAVFIGLVAMLVVLVARRIFARRGPGPRGAAMPMPRSGALDELELRYARGDIARDDYLTRRTDLMASAQSWAPPPAVPPSLPGWTTPPIPPPAPVPPPPQTTPPTPQPPVEPPPPPAAA